MGAVDRYTTGRDGRDPGFAGIVDREVAIIRSFDQFVNAVRELAASGVLKQSEIAERAGMAPSNLSRLLNSTDGNPELDTLTRIADALGCDLALRPRDPAAA